MTAYHDKNKKRYGTKFYVEQGKRLYASLTPEQIAKTLEAAHAKNRAHVWTEAERRNLSKGHITSTPKGNFGICRLCRLIVYVSERNTRAECHAFCLAAWRSKTKSFGYPPRPEGRIASSDYLAISFSMCVRRLLRGEEIGEWNMGHGTGLAAKHDLTRKGARIRIREFLKRLPSDERGSKVLHRWAGHLLPAARARGYKL